MSFVFRFIDRLCMAIYSRGQRAYAASQALAAARRRGEASERSDERFEAFQRVWRFEAHEVVGTARRLFLNLPEQDQALAIEWAPRYFAACEANARRPMTASTWLRGRGWLAAPSSAAKENAA
jgi:hypothetical protein